MTDAVRRNFINNTHGRFDRNEAILIRVQSKALHHWMILAVRHTTSLRQLDRFLCDIWLECCGHMNHFEIDGTQYSNRVPGPGDGRLFDTDLAEPEERHMVHALAELLKVGQRFTHKFDYGDTTCLDLECAAELPEPNQCMPNLTGPRNAYEGCSKDFITIVARNFRP